MKRHLKRKALCFIWLPFIFSKEDEKTKYVAREVHSSFYSLTDFLLLLPVRVCRGDAVGSSSHCSPLNNKRINSFIRLFKSKFLFLYLQSLHHFFFYVFVPSSQLQWMRTSNSSCASCQVYFVTAVIHVKTKNR